MIKDIVRPKKVIPLERRDSFVNLKREMEKEQKSKSVKVSPRIEHGNYDISEDMT